VPNNYPQLPVRSDGPFLVWLGVLPNDQAFETQFAPVAEQAQQKLFATGLLRNTAELVVLHPTHRSRLRWITETAMRGGQ
jgi:DNA-binding SARP family transcriptional activator